MYRGINKLSVMETKVLVTGAAGFMPSHLVDQLITEGHDVIAVDNLEGGKREYVNPEATFYEIDMRYRAPIERLIKQQKPQVIFHLAAHAAEGQSVFNPIYTVDQNIIGFLNLIVPAINEGFETFVFTSSMAVYGDQELEGLMPYPKIERKGFHENMGVYPVDPYGITKSMIERFLEIYSKEFGFNYIIIRPHNVYGPRQSLTDPYRNVFGIWMNRIMHGKAPMIYSDGTQTRAFTYINDCTPYIAKSAWTKEAYGEIFNVGSEEVTTINEACKTVMAAMDFNGEPTHTPERPLEVKHAWCSSEKAKKILGYKTTTPLIEGVTKMAEWAKTVGPQPFNYWDEKFEITKRVPKVWSDREI